MQIAPGGQRFAIDEENSYVEWMDFSFYWSFRRDTGIRLWDIKYKGKKIMHELGLDEALAHCASFICADDRAVLAPEGSRLTHGRSADAGNDPVQSGTSYLDTYYGQPRPLSFLATSGLARLPRAFC